MARAKTGAKGREAGRGGRRSSLGEEIGKRGAFESAEQEAYLNLVRTHAMLSEGFARLFKGHGISEAQYNVLRIVGAASGGDGKKRGSAGGDDGARGGARRTARDEGRRATPGASGGGGGKTMEGIGAEMVARDPDVTRLVDRLERAGLVERRRSADDRRVVLVRITGKGRGLLRRLREPVRALHREQLGHLGAERLEELSALLVAARHHASEGSRFAAEAQRAQRR